MSCWRLTGDGSFTIAGSGATPWLPASAAEAPPGRVHLDVVDAPLGLARPDDPPLLSLLDVGCWIEGDEVRLRDPAGARDGSLRLAAGRGTIGALPGAHLEPILTIAAALLLGRHARALVHAAAVVAPSGGVWLLTGDTHAGKSTTVATLIRGGWGWLADDQVLLRDGGREILVEGWARDPNLDAGYARGAITGRRVAVERTRLGRTPQYGEFPLAGVLLPKVEHELPTAIGPASGADLFAALVRQSPWLLADRDAAASLQPLLTRAATTRRATLTLGGDSYGQAAPLLAALGSLIE